MPLFTTPRLVLISVSAALLSQAAFAAPNGSPRDLPSGNWAAGSVKRVLHENILGTTPDGRFQGDKPVTRYELAVALDRFVQYIEAGRKPLHAQAIKTTLPATPAATVVQRQALIHLVSNGFISSKSPLVGKIGTSPVTAKELSDALASVTIALSDRAEPPQKD